MALQSTPKISLRAYLSPLIFPFSSIDPMISRAEPGREKEAEKPAVMNTAASRTDPIVGYLYDFKLLPDLRPVKPAALFIFKKPR